MTEVRKLFFGKIDPSLFFAGSAALFFILYTLWLPPMQVPDEYNHFYRAVQLAGGEHQPQKYEQRLGGQLPASLEEFLLPLRILSYVPEQRFNSQAFFETFKVPYSAGRTAFVDFPNTANYNIVSYLPQVTAIYVLKKLGCTVPVIYYGARLFVFLCWMLSMYAVIRMLPFCKWLFTLILLLPMNLQVSCSLSADTMTNILSFLFIGLVLRTCMQPEKLKGKTVVLFLALGLALALAKVVYAGLLFLLLILPPAKFRRPGHRWLIPALVIIPSFFLAWCWSQYILGFYIPYKDYNPFFRDLTTLSPPADYFAQKAWLSGHKSEILPVIWKSITDDMWFYSESYIGRFGAYMDLRLPPWLISVAFMMIAVVAIAEPQAQRLRLGQRIMILFTFLITYTAILFSQYLTWYPVGSDMVSSLQGRYLIPVLPLLWMLPGGLLNIRRFPLWLPVILFVITANFYSLRLLYDRYFRQNFREVVEFRSGFETTDAAGRLGTDLRNVNLVYTGKLVPTARTGRYGLLVEPGTEPKRMSVFYDLEPGDLLEINVWKKGSGGHISIAGGGKNCEDYKVSNGRVMSTDERGWDNLNFTYIVSLACKSWHLGFYPESSEGQPVIFDDLYVTVKRKRIR